jgi:hypothetical protein
MPFLAELHHRRSALADLGQFFPLLAQQRAGQLDLSKMQCAVLNRVENARADRQRLIANRLPELWWRLRQAFEYTLPEI